MKTEIRLYSEENIDFHTRKIPEAGSNYLCWLVILIDSVLWNLSAFLGQFWRLKENNFNNDAFKKTISLYIYIYIYIYIQRKYILKTLVIYSDSIRAFYGLICRKNVKMFMWLEYLQYKKNNEITQL